MNELKIGDLLFLNPHVLPGIYVDPKKYIIGWVIGASPHGVIYRVQWCDMPEPTYEGPGGALKCRERFLEFQKTLGVLL